RRWHRHIAHHDRRIGQFDDRRQLVGRQARRHRLRHRADLPAGVAGLDEGVAVGERNGDEIAELHAPGQHAARGMLARGVKLGDFVTIALPNGNAFIEACYACWKIGAVPQPVSSRLPANELAAIVELANPPIVVSDVPVPAPRPVVSSQDLLRASSDDGDLPEAISPSWKAPTSGGSTGRPKLIVSGTRGVTVKGGLEGSFWRYDADSTVLMPGPLYHNGPFGCVFGALNAGAHVVVMPKFDAADTLAHIEKYKAS